uniref:Uncharacterized protein n=1 Tax=Candidatus Kentrum sp. TC TaxID=2126339 RepID=A0A450ZF19_9GAMM|nr:MAG: hypothetical protein BECKTC1821D_GA0114238_11711 [Candidatus Kentron sp. TC]
MERNHSSVSTLNDFVCGFRYARDVEKFHNGLPKRLEEFGLSTAPEKTGILRFSRFHPSMKRRFGFLSLELYWHKDRKGIAESRAQDCAQEVTRSM